MSQSWKLVEAEPVIVKVENSQNQNQKEVGGRYNNRRGQGQGQGRNNGRRQFGRRDGKGRERRHHNDYYGGIYIPDTPETRAYFTQMAVQQIECVFSVENLCGDTFLRSYMDQAGFVPLPFVCNYISCYGVEYSDLVASIQQSPTLEYDSQNETIRVREGWQMWLMPNLEGGLGLPLYIKQNGPNLNNEGLPIEVEQNYYYDYPIDENGAYLQQPQEGWNIDANGYYNQVEYPEQWQQQQQQQQDPSSYGNNNGEWIPTVATNENINNKTEIETLNNYISNNNSLSRPEGTAQETA